MYGYMKDIYERATQRRGREEDYISPVMERQGQPLEISPPANQ